MALVFALRDEFALPSPHAVCDAAVSTEALPAAVRGSAAFRVPAFSMQRPLFCLVSLAVPLAGDTAAVLLLLCGGGAVDPAATAVGGGSGGGSLWRLSLGSFIARVTEQLLSATPTHVNSRQPPAHNWSTGPEPQLVHFHLSVSI